LSVAVTLNEFDAALLVGFGEPITFASLRAARHRGPDTKPGVYAVIYPFDREPVFLPVGSGGRHKGKDPNVGLEELRDRWVPASRLLYFGKAGGPDENEDLHGRIATFSGFGRGARVGHRGGRLIWQIEGSADLLICWRPTGEDEVPRRVEGHLIRQFVARYCKMPFANLCE
jgi:hypothetical protein